MDRSDELGRSAWSRNSAVRPEARVEGDNGRASARVAGGERPCFLLYNGLKLSYIDAESGR